MKIYISAFDRKTHTKLRLDDKTKYQLAVNEHGELYVTSLIEKDEDNYDKQLDVKFEITAK